MFQRCVSVSSAGAHAHLSSPFKVCASLKEVERSSDLGRLRKLLLYSCLARSSAEASQTGCSSSMCSISSTAFSPPSPAGHIEMLGWVL